MRAKTDTKSHGNDGAGERTREAGLTTAPETSSKSNHDNALVYLLALVLGIAIIIAPMAIPAWMACDMVPVLLDAPESVGLSRPSVSLYEAMTQFGGAGIGVGVIVVCLIVNALELVAYRKVFSHDRRHQGVQWCIDRGIRKQGARARTSEARHMPMTSDEEPLPVMAAGGYIYLLAMAMLGTLLSVISMVCMAQAGMVPVTFTYAVGVVAGIMLPLSLVDIVILIAFCGELQGVEEVMRREANDATERQTRPVELG